MGTLLLRTADFARRRIDRFRKLRRSSWPGRWNALRRRRRMLPKRLSAETTRLIVFMLPGNDIASGGILSAISICQVTRQLRHIHGAEAVICTMPFDPPLSRFSRFQNQEFLFGLEEVLERCLHLEAVLFHVPEYAAGRLGSSLGGVHRQALQRIVRVHFNILLQDIGGAPSRDQVKLLEELGSVSCTAAHERYASEVTAKQLGVPVQLLSTFVSPELFNRVPYSDKRNRLVISSDRQPRKLEVLAAIRDANPNLRMRIVRNMKYEDYKKLIERSKWTVTFGEGLDGYFVETVFSGGIAFATYNDRFFTPDFAGLRTVYANVDEMIARMAADIKALDEPNEFASYHSEQFAICAKYYIATSYRQNVERFYRTWFLFDRS